jgi:polysaccharide biosynthesis transport protein
MNLTQFVLIFRARWKIILGALLLGVLIVAVWAFILPRNYKAAAQVLVNVRAPDIVATPGSAADSGIAPMLAPDYLQTQVDVIKSDRVALAAVQRLGLTSSPDSLKSYRDSGTAVAPELYFANLLRRGLKVSPSTDSRVISIEFVNPNPQSAAAVANAFAEAYRDVSLDLQSEPAKQSSGWYKKSTADVRQQLADAQAKLSKRRAELGVTAPSSDLGDADEVQLSSLTQQLASAQALDAAQRSHTGGGAMPDAMVNPVVQSLATDIARLEAQRKQLATFAGPNNVDYQQLTSQIDTLRAEETKQKALVAQSVSTSASQTGSSVGSLKAAVAAQRQKVIASQRNRGEISALEQDVLNLKQTYDQLVAKQAQTNLLGASSQTNISILSPAPVPQEPAGLGPIPKLLAGIFGGLVIGFVIALMLEFLDQRMRSPDDAAVWLGIPNLGGVHALTDGSEPRLIGSRVRRYLPKPS